MSTVFEKFLLHDLNFTRSSTQLAGVWKGAIWSYPEVFKHMLVKVAHIVQRIFTKPLERVKVDDNL